jgi:hypothetical protein
MHFGIIFISFLAFFEMLSFFVIQYTAMEFVQINNNNNINNNRINENNNNNQNNNIYFLKNISYTVTNFLGKMGSDVIDYLITFQHARINEHQLN